MQQRVHGDSDGVKDLAADQIEFDAEHPHFKIAGFDDAVAADALAGNGDFDLVGGSELVLGLEQDGIFSDFQALRINGLTMAAHNDALRAFEAGLSIAGSGRG
ncbi:MAG: hypothetical protein JNK87_11505 [Bryobacterales bacterium]|nr:hypothetical protein [Bryobacterales bacterium]